MPALGILGSEFFTNIVLPFLLVFVVVYAILQKSKILGARTDIDVITSLVFGLIVVAVPSIINVTNKIIPIVAVIIIILLAWMLMLGFIGHTEDGGLNKGLRTALTIILALALIGTILWATGLAEKISSSTNFNNIWPIGVMVALIIAVIAIVTQTNPAKKKD